MDLKVGDRVSVTGWESGEVFNNEFGVIVDLGENPYIGVSFDSRREILHACNDNCEDGHGWYVGSDCVTKLEETEVDTNNPLYNFRAHEELGEDAWGGLSKAVHDVVWADGIKEGAYTWEYVGPHFKAWESEYKSSTGLPIPGAWRSAKSVIKNAMSAGVAMWLDDEPRGKTAVEKDIKAAREAEKAKKDPQDMLDRMVERAYKFYEQNVEVASWADAIENAIRNNMKLGGE